jgi:hypothetical protein
MNLSYEKNACTICGSHRRGDFIEICGGALFCPACAKDAKISRPKKEEPKKPFPTIEKDLNDFFGGIFK